MYMKYILLTNIRPIFEQLETEQEIYNDADNKNKIMQYYDILSVL